MRRQPGLRPELIHRPGEGTSLREVGVDPPENLLVLLLQAAVAADLNGMLSLSMRSMITASLRASATLALLMPARLAIRIAQLLSCAQPLIGFVRMMWAAS